MSKMLTLLLILAVIVAGCENEQGLYPCEEARAFADQHFDENAYRAYEFDLALSAEYGDSCAYTSGDPDIWTAETWDTKITYLPKQGFTHELPTQDTRDINPELDEQYYVMIGEYLHRFGAGWKDTPAWDPNNHHDLYVPYYNGSSYLRDEYMEMW